jgi:hypothetical protein
LIRGKIPESVTAFKVSPYKKDFPEIAKMVDNLTNVNDIVLDSLKDQVGKEIKVELKEGNKNIKIKKVEKGLIHAEFKKAKLTIIKKYSIKDLDNAEVLKRLNEYDKVTANLMRGIKAPQV